MIETAALALLLLGTILGPVVPAMVGWGRSSTSGTKVGLALFGVSALINLAMPFVLFHESREATLHLVLPGLYWLSIAITVAATVLVTRDEAVRRQGIFAGLWTLGVLGLYYATIH